MKKIYLGLSLFLGITASAQLNYQTANATNITTTYTSLGATGTAITTANTDDANSAAINIGFTFNYNGQAFTQFIFNTNGFIKLGATAPATAAIFGLAGNDGSGGVLHGGTSSNSIAVFNHDLIATASVDYRVLTSGTVGNRVTRIEWKGVSEKTTTPAQQYSSIDLQIRLFEGSNAIELAYANFVPNTASADAFKVSNVGLIGTDNTGTNAIFVNKGSTAAWSVASFANVSTNATQSFNFRRTVAPDAGRTFRFVPTFANDLNIVRIETLGKLPKDFAGPQSIKALVANIGSNANATFTATLTVTGANTYTNTKTITTPTASGANVLVSFDPVTFANAGTNNVTVTLTSDDNNANNSASLTQIVGGVFSFADNSPITGSVGFNTGAGLILTKYRMVGSGFVTAVNVSISSTATSTGNTVRGVVLNTAGTIIGQSADFVIQASDLGILKTFIMQTPPQVINDSFYVGLAQTANATTGYFPVNLQNEGLPTRDQAYWTAPLAGGAIPTVNTAIGRFFTEAVISINAIVPLDFITFNGTLQGGKTFLNWSTTNEVNADRFEIERSVNATSFASIGTVAAKNAINVNTYSFSDNGLSSVAANVLYYRLKQVDKDGRFKYSATIKITKLSKGVEITVVNPAKDAIQLQIATEVAEKASLQLVNINGQVLVSKDVQLAVGSNSFTLGEQLKLSKGLYLLRIVVGQTVETKQVLVD